MSVFATLPIDEWSSPTDGLMRSQTGRPVLGRQTAEKNTDLSTRQDLVYRNPNWPEGRRYEQPVPNVNQTDRLTRSKPGQIAPIARCEQNIVNGILRIINIKEEANSNTTNWNTDLNYAMNSMSLCPEVVLDNGCMEWYGQTRQPQRSPAHHDRTFDSLLAPPPPGFGPRQMTTPTVSKSPHQHSAAVTFWRSRKPTSPAEEANANWSWNSSLPRNEQPKMVSPKYARDSNGLPNGGDRTKWFYCPLCDCKVNSLYQLNIHNEGVKHRKRLAGKHHSKTFNSDLGYSRPTSTPGEQNGWFSPLNSCHAGNFGILPRPDIHDGQVSSSVPYHAIPKENVWHPTSPTDVDECARICSMHAGYDAKSMAKRRGYDSDSQYGSDDESLQSGCSAN